jgi:FAD/FMN-containing dehydrogenase
VRVCAVRCCSPANRATTARTLWNRAFDRKPALIVRCAGAADVTAALGFARAQGLLTAVRGGGHSLSGQSACDGGLIIDLSLMGGIRIDPLAKRARIEPGVRLAALDREAQAFGLATPLGTVSDTGAAGLTLGGGFAGITPALIGTMVDFISAPEDNLGMWLQHQGGAISRVRPQDTAYWNRGASHNLGAFAFWNMPAADAEHKTDWVRRAWAQIEPLTRGQYANLANTDDRDSRVHAAYGDNYPRLATLKKRYDPSNLFRLNANIKPA